MHSITDSQNTQIENYLKSGKSITPIEALQKFNCFRLGARIWDLRNKKKLPIKTTIVIENKKHFALYELVS